MTQKRKFKKVTQQWGKTALIAIVAIFIASTANAQSKQKVAVYVTGDADAGTKKVIGAKMVSAITNDDNYAAVERTADFLAELNKEHTYQQSGAVDDRQLARLGQQFGVAFVCVADVSIVYGSTFIAARMINVSTGLIIATADRDKEVNGMADLTSLSEDVSAALLNKRMTTTAKPQKQDEDLQELARKTLGIEFVPDDIGPFSNPNSAMCREGWRLPTEAEMRWLISKGICKENCYWLDDTKTEQFGSQNRGFVIGRYQSGGEYYYRSYICGGSVDKFKYRTYEYIWNGSDVTKSDYTQHEWSKELYIRCVRKID